MSSVTQPASTKPGTVAHFGGTVAPTGWIKANGAAISRTTYAELFAAIGTTFGAGDGVTTFNVPDLRGEFLRGFDDGRGVDTGRVFGSAQAGQMPSHTHGMTAKASTGALSSPGWLLGDPGAATQTLTSDATGGTSNASENRPRNVAMLACIKY